MTRHLPMIVANVQLMAMVALSGCAATTTSVSSTTAPLGGGSAETHAAPSGPVAGRDLRPGTDGTEQWHASAGLFAGEDFELTTRSSTVAGASFETRTANLETAYWSISSDGVISLHAVDSHPDKARSIFDPPLLIAPASLAATDAVHTESAMRVVALPGARTEREKGVGRRTVRYVGDEQIGVDGEVRTAQVIEVEFVAEMERAQALRHSRLWVVPGQGVVAEDWNETLTILKLFKKKSSQTSARVGVELPPRQLPRQPASDAPTDSKR